MLFSTGTRQNIIIVYSTTLTFISNLNIALIYVSAAAHQSTSVGICLTEPVGKKREEISACCYWFWDFVHSRVEPEIVLERG